MHVTEAKTSVPAATESTGAAKVASTSAAPTPPTVPSMPNVNLVIATPCFGGQISALYAASLF